MTQKNCMLEVFLKDNITVSAAYTAKEILKLIGAKWTDIKGHLIVIILKIRVDIIVVNLLDLVNYRPSPLW